MCSELKGARQPQLQKPLWVLSELPRRAHLLSRCWLMGGAAVDQVAVAVECDGCRSRQVLRAAPVAQVSSLVCERVGRDLGTGAFGVRGGHADVYALEGDCWFGLPLSAAPRATRASGRTSVHPVPLTCSGVPEALVSGAQPYAR